MLWSPTQSKGLVYKTFHYWSSERNKKFWKFIHTKMLCGCMWPFRRIRILRKYGRESECIRFKKKE
jgi:hypothetical protein